MSVNFMLLSSFINKPWKFVRFIRCEIDLKKSFLNSTNYFKKFSIETFIFWKSAVSVVTTKTCFSQHFVVVICWPTLPSKLEVVSKVKVDSYRVRSNLWRSTSPTSVWISALFIALWPTYKTTRTPEILIQFIKNPKWSHL